MTSFKAPHPLKVLVSSTVHNGDSPHLRSKLSEAFADTDAELVNLHGSQRFKVSDVRQNIEAHDAFVFLPIRPRSGMETAEKDRLLQQFTIFASLVVGMQTADDGMYLEPSDPDSPTKPVIVVGKSWSHFEHAIKRLQTLGTFRQDYTELVRFVYSVDDVVPTINSMLSKPGYRRMPEILDESEPHLTTEEALRRQSGRKPPPFTVGVFCSASTRNEVLINRAYQLGKEIGSRDWGLMTGAGALSLMGAVNKGAHEVGGWTGGVNTPKIAALEELPVTDWLRLVPDIYKRIDLMIENAQGFFIEAGGMGTLQEFLYMLLLSHQDDKVMKNKPIVLINEQIKEPGTNRDVSFWTSAIRIARAYGFNNSFAVANNIHEAVEIMASRIEQTLPESTPERLRATSPHVVNRRSRPFER